MRVKGFAAIAGMMLFAGCTPSRPANLGAFIAAPSTIDGHPDASGEDFILALPPYLFHEESVPDFVARVRGARTLPQNHGNGMDYLYCPGDGTSPTKEFILEPVSRKLTIRVHSESEPGAAPYTVTMRRVRGGWIQGG